MGGRCVFCELINENKVLIYEDSMVVIFKPRSADAKHHVLLCPKEHIININYLDKSHLNLLSHMELKAKEFFKSEYGVDNLYMGFHIPPFYSIKHLHMHCLSELNWYNRMCFRSLDDQVKRIESIK